MKNAASVEKLTSTGTDIASRMKNLFSGSPASKRKRTMSADALSQSSSSSSAVTATSSSLASSSPVFGAPLNELVSKGGEPIPFLIKKVVQHVEAEGLDQVGIYRINGNVKAIEKLRAAFDKDGDASFEYEDIASVAGLLKLFLRELPDGIIPEILMPHFVSLQQSYSAETTPEALDALKHCLHFLPEQNHTVLKFIIQHLAKVAEHSDKNKMTSVSLSIVFGPNLFHCDSGLEGLRTQGYCNSCVCRMIQNYRVLFEEGGEGEGEGKRKRKGGRKMDGVAPAKPLPYLEYKASKSRESLLSPASAESQGDDLYNSHSERSIDEAIMERSQGTLSPTSPSHLPHDDKEHPSGPSKVVSPTKVVEYRVPVFSESSNTPPSPRGDKTSIDEEQQEEEGAGFQRRNAKRGMTFRPRADAVNTKGFETEAKSGSKAQSPSHSQSTPSTTTSPTNTTATTCTPTSSTPTSSSPATLSVTPSSSQGSKEEEPPNRSPSPYSQTSPATSPPTSPALTPRTHNVVNSVIGASIRTYLFKPPRATETKKGSKHSDAKKQNIYGLYLPESISPVGSSMSDWSASTISPDHKTYTIPSSSTSLTTVGVSTTTASTSSGSTVGEGGAQAAERNSERGDGVVFRRATDQSDGAAKDGVVLRHKKAASSDSAKSNRNGVIMRRSKTMGGVEVVVDGGDDAKNEMFMRNRTVGGIDNDNEMANKLGIIESESSDEIATGVVIRRTKNMQNQRNRKSALHGDEVSPASTEDAISNPLADANVRLISVSPEHRSSSGSTAEEGVVVESRTGRVLDLVKEFDENESRLEKEGNMASHRSSHRRSLSGEAGTHDEKKSKLKAFDMFEKSGMVMGMSNSKIKPMASVLSASEEDVFATGSHPDPIPTPAIIQTRNYLSTTASDDVFLSPAHSPALSDLATTRTGIPDPAALTITNAGSLSGYKISPAGVAESRVSSTAITETTENKQLTVVSGNENQQSKMAASVLNQIPRTSTLSHLTLSRPKGPSSRRMPSRFSTPSTPTQQEITKRHDNYTLETWLSNVKTGCPPQEDAQLSANSSLEAVKSSRTFNKESSESGSADVLKRSKVFGTTTDENVISDSSLVQASKRSSSFSKELPKASTQDQEQSQVKMRSRRTYSDGGATKATKRSPKRSSSTEASLPSSVVPVKTLAATTDPTPLTRSTHSHMDSTSVPHPLGSADSTPTGSPSISKPHSEKEVRRLPQLKGGVKLDLTSLAPEQKQVVSSVRTGWSESDGVPRGSSDSIKSSESIKDLSRKIHELKNLVREFEAGFVEKHKRRPSSHEKSPIRSKLIELAKLKKKFKELRDSSSEDRLSQTVPLDVKGSPPGSSTRLLNMSETAIPEGITSLPSKALPPSFTIPSAASKKGPSAVTSPLAHVLNKIMLNLEARRKGSGRPEELELMDDSQIRDEKQAIQKALLNFEKHHGRPQNHEEKEAMRPLYDRYRAVKRICSGGTRDRENSRVSIGLVTPRTSNTTSFSSTTDTLFLNDSLLQATSALDASELSKSGDALLAVGNTDEADKSKVEGRGTGGRGQRKSSSAGGTRGRGETVGAGKDTLSPALLELKEENTKLLSEKAELRKVLREFENNFIAKNGRSVTKEDRKPMEKEYSQYKNIKTRLKTLESLMMKMEPQKTI